MRLFFSAQGRIPRHQWWIGVIALVVVNLIAFWILWRSYGESVILNPGIRTLAFFISLPLLYMAFCVAAKRFHDRGKPAWYAGVPALISLLKLMLDWAHLTGDPWHHSGGVDTLFLIVQGGIGIWFLIELGCLRGTEGPNRYGPDPLNAVPEHHARHPALR